MEPLRIEEGNLLRRSERLKRGLDGLESDKWTKGETDVLIEAFAEQYSKLRKQTLSRKHWEYLAKEVNTRPGKLVNAPIRDKKQCRIRMDTLKASYKACK